MPTESTIVCAVCRLRLQTQNKMYCSQTCYLKFLNTAEAQRIGRENGKKGGAPLGNTNGTKKEYAAPNHEGPGSLTLYEQGKCRCEKCTMMQRLKMREYRRQKMLRKQESCP